MDLGSRIDGLAVGDADYSWAATLHFESPKSLWLQPLLLPLDAAADPPSCATMAEIFMSVLVFSRFIIVWLFLVKVCTLISLIFIPNGLIFHVCL